MAFLPIVTKGNSILTEPTTPVKFPLDSELHELIADMIATMNHADGIGIAAPQVGRSERICIVKTSDGDLPLVNPQIVAHSWRKERDEEGCLSIPGTFGLVDRYRSVTVRAMRPNGEPIHLPAKGLLARILQHEIDHLDGVLFIDRAKKMTRQDDNPRPHYATR